MLPVISLGSVQISMYWLMFVVGVCSMGALALRARGRYGLSVPRALALTLMLTVCGLLGTKLLYILENWRETLENGLTLGGQSFFGAVYLIPLLMPLGGRLLGLSPGRTLDACAPCVASIIGFMRMGCFLNGCCGGWEMTLGSLRFHWPTQIMESLGDFLILGILLLLFNSWRKVALILICLPFALCGITPALLATNQPFTFMAIIGMMGLVGMMVKNAIVLVDEIARLQNEEKMSSYFAVVEATVSRVRPVLMASLTTIVGMIPLVGDPMYGSMAITIMGGLTVGTIITLILLPLFYTALFRVKKTTEMYNIKRKKLS